MFESILSTILNTTVGTFLKDVSSDQLKISLGGKLRLENVEIKPEAFDFLKLPVAIRHGRVGVLEIQLSWTGLTSKPVQVTLSDVYIVVGVADDQTVDVAELEAKILKQRLDALNNWELLRFPEKEVQTESKGTLMKIVDTIVDHVTVTVSNVHIMLEGEGVNVGVGVGGLKVYPTDAQGNQVFKCIDTTELSRRKIEVSDVCVYVNVDPARAAAATEDFMNRRVVALKGDNIALSTYDRLKKAKSGNNSSNTVAQQTKSLTVTSPSTTYPLVRPDNEPYNLYCRSLFADINNPRWCHIISPFSVAVDFTMRKPPPHVLQQRTPMEAAMAASVDIGVITIGIQQHQYQALLRILSMISQNPAAVDMMRKQGEEDVGVMELDYVVNKVLKDLRTERKKAQDPTHAATQDSEDVLLADLTPDEVVAVYERLSPVQQEQVLSGMRYAELYKRNLLAYPQVTAPEETVMRDTEKLHPLLRVVGWREAAIRVAAFEYQTDSVTWKAKPSSSFFASIFGSRAPPPPSRHMSELLLKELIMFPSRHAAMEKKKKAAEEGVSPFYPNMVINLALAGCEAALLEPNRARKVSLGLYGISVAMQMRSESQGIAVAIARLEAEDYSNPNTLYPHFMRSSAPDNSSFFHADISMGDSSIRPELGYDMAITGAMAPVFITFVPKLMLSLADFFAPPADLSIGAEAVKELTSRYSDLKQGLQTSVVASLANRSRMFIDLDIAAPTIIIPAVVDKTQKPAFTGSALSALRSRQAGRKSSTGEDKPRSHAMCICVGRITVTVTPPALADVAKNKALLEASKADPTLISNLSLSSKLERLYDYYNVRLHQVSVYCVDADKVSTPSAGDYLLKPFALAVSAGLSLIDDSVAAPAERINAPGMAIDVDVGAIDLVVSPVLLARVLRVGKGIMNAMHDVAAAKNAAANASTSSSTEIVLDTETTESSTKFSDTLEELVDKHASKLVAALTAGKSAADADSNGYENVHAVQMAVFVKLSRLSLNIVNDHIPMYPIPVLAIAAESIHVTLAMRARDMSVCTVMGGVFITDGLTETQYPSSTRKYLMNSELEPICLPSVSPMLSRDGVDTNAFAADAMRHLLSVGYNAQAAENVTQLSPAPFLPTAALDMPRAVPLSVVKTAFMTVMCILPQRTSPLYAFADTFVTVAIAPLSMTINREALPPLLLFAMKQVMPPCPTCEDAMYGPADLDFSPPQLWATPTVDLTRDLNDAAVDALITKIIPQESESNSATTPSTAAPGETYTIPTLLTALTRVSDDDLDKCFYGFGTTALPAYPCPTAEPLRKDVLAWANTESPSEATRTVLGQRVAEFILAQRARYTALSAKLSADGITSEELLDLHHRANARTMLQIERLAAHLNYLEMHSANFEQRIAARAAMDALRQKLALRRRALLIVREKERDQSLLSRRWRGADLGAQLGGVCVVDGDGVAATHTLELTCEEELQELLDTKDPAKLAQRRLLDIFNFDERLLRVSPPVMPASLVPKTLTQLANGDLTAVGPQVVPLSVDARVHMGGIVLHLASQQLPVLTFSLDGLTVGAAISAFSTNAKVTMANMDMYTEDSPIAKRYTDMVLALDAEFAKMRVSSSSTDRVPVYRAPSSVVSLRSPLDNEPASLMDGGVLVRTASPDLQLHTVIEEDEVNGDTSLPSLLPSIKSVTSSPSASGPRTLSRVGAAMKELNAYLDERCSAADSEKPYMPPNAMAAYARQMHRRAQHVVPHKNIMYTVEGKDLLSACVCLRNGEIMVRDDTDEFEYFSTASVDRMLGQESAAHAFTLTQTGPSGKTMQDLSLPTPAFNTPVLVRNGCPVAPIAATLTVGGLRIVLCYVVVDLLQKYVAGLDQVMVVIAQSYTEKQRQQAPAPSTTSAASVKGSVLGATNAQSGPATTQFASPPLFAEGHVSADAAAAPMFIRSGTAFHDAAVVSPALSGASGATQSPVLSNAGSHAHVGIDVPITGYSPPMGSVDGTAYGSIDGGAFNGMELPISAEAEMRNAPSSVDTMPAWQQLGKYLNKQLSEGSSSASAFGLLFDVEVTVKDIAITIPITSTSPEMLVMRLGKLVVSSKNELVNYNSTPLFTVAHCPTIAMPKLQPQTTLNRMTSFSRNSRQSFSAYRPSYLRKISLSRNGSFSRMPTGDDDEFQDMEEYSTSTPSLIAKNSVAFGSSGTYFSLLGARSGDLPASSAIIQANAGSSTAADPSLPLDVMWTMSAKPSLGPAASTIHYHTLQPTFTIALNQYTISTFAFADADGVREQSAAPRQVAGVRLRMMPLMFLDGARITATNSAYVPVADVAVRNVAKYALTHTALTFHPTVPARDWSVDIDCAHSNIIVAQPHIAAGLSLLAESQFLQGNLAEKSHRQFPRFFSPLPTDFANEHDLSYLAFYLPKQKQLIEQAARSLREARKSLEKKEHQRSRREHARKLAASKPAAAQATATETPFEVDEEARKLEERRQLYNLMTEILNDTTALAESANIDPTLAVGVDPSGLMTPIASSTAVQVLRRHAAGIAPPNMVTDASSDVWESMSVLSRSMSVSASKRSHSIAGEWGLPWAQPGAAGTAAAGGADQPGLSVDVRMSVPHACLLLCTNITKAVSPALTLASDFSLLLAMESNGEMGVVVSAKDMMMVSGNMATTDLQALYSSLSNTLVDAAILQPCNARVAVSMAPKSALEKPLNSSDSLFAVHPRFRYLPVRADKITLAGAASTAPATTATAQVSNMLPRAAASSLPVSAAPSYSENTPAGTLVTAVANDGTLTTAAVSTRQLDGPAIVVDCRVTEMKMKVSYSDYERLMTCFAALSMPAADTAAPAPAATAAAAPAPAAAAESRPAAKQPSATASAPAPATSQSLVESLPYSMGDMRVNVSVDPITISLLNDSAGFTVPFLLIGCHSTKVAISALAHTRTIELNTGAEIKYYNGSVASWEPLLEPASMHISVGQDALRGMRVLVESKNPTNLNMTRSMMDGVNQSLSMLATAQKAMQKRNAAKLLELTGESDGLTESEIGNSQEESIEAMVLSHGNDFAELQADLQDATQVYASAANTAFNSSTGSTSTPSADAAARSSPQQQGGKGSFAFVRLANHTEYPLYYMFGQISQPPELAELPAPAATADQLELINEETSAQRVALVHKILLRHTAALFASRPSIVQLCRLARILTVEQMQLLNSGYIPCTPLAVHAFRAYCQVLFRSDYKPDPFSSTETPVPARQRLLWSFLVHAARLRALRDLASGRTGLLGSRQEIPLYPDAGSSSTRTLATLQKGKGNNSKNGSSRADQQMRAAKRRLISLQLGNSTPLCNIPIDTMGSYSFRVKDKPVFVEIAVANGIKVISVHSNKAIVNVLDVPLQVLNDIVMPGETYYLPLAKAEEPITVRPVTTVATTNATTSHAMGTALQPLLQTAPGTQVPVHSTYNLSDSVAFSSLTNGRVITCSPANANTNAPSSHFSMVVQRWRCRSVTYVSLAPPVAVTNLLTEPCTLKLLTGVAFKKGSVVDQAAAVTTASASIMPSHCMRSHTGILHAPVSTAPAPAATAAPTLALSLALPRLGLTSDPIQLPTANDSVLRVKMTAKNGAALTILARITYAPALLRATTTSAQQAPTLHALSSGFADAVESQLTSPVKSTLLAGASPLAYIGSRLAPSAMFAAVNVALYTPLWIMDTSYLGLVAATAKTNRPSHLQLPQQLHALASTTDIQDGVTQTRTAALIAGTTAAGGESKELLAAASGAHTPISDALYSRAVMFTLEPDQNAIQVRRAGPQTPGVKPNNKGDGSGIVWKSAWSDAFDVSYIGATIQLTMRDSTTDQEWVVSGVVRNAPAPFVHTKVLVLSAGIMIVNRLPMPITLRQHSLAHVGASFDDSIAGVKWVEPHGISQWHWTQRRDAHLTSFKMVTDTDPFVKIGQKQRQRAQQVGNALYNALAKQSDEEETAEKQKSFSETPAIADTTVVAENWNTQQTMNGKIISATRKPVSFANSSVVPGLLSLSVPENDGNIVQTVAGQQWHQGVWEWSGYLDLSKVGDTTILLRNSVTHKCFMVSARVVMTSPDFVGAAGNTFTVVLEPHDLSFARYRIENRTRIDTVLFSQVGSDAWMDVSPMETSLYALDQPTGAAKLQVQVVNGSQTAYAQYELGKLGYLGSLTLRTSGKTKKLIKGEVAHDAISSQFSAELAYREEEGETHKVHVTVRGEGPTHVIIFSNTKEVADDVGSLLAADVDSLVYDDECKHVVGLNTYNVGRSKKEDDEAPVQGVRVGGITVLPSDILDPVGAVSKEIMEAATANEDAKFATYKAIFAPPSSRLNGTEVGVELDDLMVDWTLLKRLFPYLSPKPRHTRSRLPASAADIADALLARKKLMENLPMKYARTIAQALRVVDLRRTDAKDILSPKSPVITPNVSMPFTSMTAPPKEVTVAASIRDAVHSSVSTLASNAEYLLIRVISARWLSAGKRNGLSDCYAIVSINGETYKSPVATNTVNPHWNMAIAVRMPPGITTDGDALDKMIVKVSIWHRNSVLSDDYLGGIIVSNLRATLAKSESAATAALEIADEKLKEDVTDKLLTLMTGGESKPVDGTTTAAAQPSTENTVNAEAIPAEASETVPAGATSPTELARNDGWAPLYAMRQNKRARGEILMEFAWVHSEAEKQERLLGLMLADMERDIVAIKQLNEQYAEDFIGVDVGVVDIDTLQLLPMHRLTRSTSPKSSSGSGTAAEVGCCGREDKEAKRQRKEHERTLKRRAKVDFKAGENIWEVVQSSLGPVEVPRGFDPSYAKIPETQTQLTLLNLCEAWVRQREAREKHLQMVDVRVAVNDIAICAENVTEKLAAYPSWIGKDVLAVMECNGHVVVLPIGSVSLKASINSRPRNSLAMKLLRRASLTEEDTIAIPVEDRAYKFERNKAEIEALFSLPSWALAQTDAAVDVKIVVVATRAHVMSCAGEKVFVPRQASVLIQHFTIPLRKMPLHGPEGELMQIGQETPLVGPHWYSASAPVADTSALAKEINDTILTQALEADAYAALNDTAAHMFTQSQNTQLIEDMVSVSLPSGLDVGLTHPGSIPGSVVGVTEDFITYTDKAGVRTDFPRIPKTPVRLNLVCALSPSSDLEDRIGMDVVARFAQFGISLVDTFSGKPEEVLYISALGCEVSLSESHTQRSMELIIQNFQIDQQCRTDVVAKDEDSIIVGPSIESIGSGKPLVHMAAVQCKTNADYPVMVFNHFTFLMQAIEIQVEEGLLWRLLALATDLFPASSAQDDASVLSALAVDKRIVFAAEDKFASQQAFYFQALHIQPLLMFFTFHVNSAARAAGAGVSINPITLALNAVTGILGNIDAAPLAFNALVIRDAYGDMSTLLQPVVQFYIAQGISQAYKIIGSIEVLGNPVSLVSGVGSGVVDFFYEPAQGLVKSPKQFGVGLAKGSAALVKSVTSGVFGAAAKITTSVGSGITVLTMDTDFAARRRARNRKKVKHALDGLGRGAGALTHGLFSGLTGLVLDPIRGAKHGGVGGFAKGLVKGLTGVVTKTASGAVDLVGLTLQGVGNTFTGVGATVERRRVRRSRFISPVGSMHDYDAMWALANSTLALINAEAGAQRGVKGAIQGVRNALELNSANNEANSVQSDIDLVMKRLTDLSKRKSTSMDVDVDASRGSGAHLTDPATLLRELQDLLPQIREKDRGKALEAIEERMRLAVKEDALQETLINCFALNPPRPSQAPIVKKNGKKVKRRRLPEYLAMVSDQRLVFVEKEAAATALAAGGTLSDKAIALNARIEDIVDIVPYYTESGNNDAAIVVTFIKKNKWHHGLPETFTVTVPTVSRTEAKLAVIRLWCTLGGANVIAASSASASTGALASITLPVASTLAIVPLTRYTVFAPTAAVAQDWAFMMGYSRSVLSPRSPSDSPTSADTHAEAVAAACQKLRLTPPTDAAAVTVLRRGATDAAYPTDTLRPSPWTCVLRLPEYQQSIWRALLHQVVEKDVHVVSVVYQRGRRMYSKSFVDSQSIVLM